MLLSGVLRTVGAAAGLLAATLFSTAGHAQKARRLYQMPASSDSQVALSGSVTPHVRAASALGRLPGETAMHGMSMVLKPTAAQQAALNQLLADQQNPASPDYHRWLTPEQFGARFGVADEDLQIIENWLTSRGFTVDSVSPSRNRIVFSGTASAVELAFSTSMQRFRDAQEDFIANSTEASLPASLATVVSGVTGLNSYRMLPPPRPQLSASPDYTTNAGATHYLVPWDIRQIYDMNSLIGQGFDGTGVKIGVLGQSAVDTNQLDYFQQKTGQPTKLPTMMLVPNTGVSNRVSGDEGESELDLEYASGSAPGASTVFVYTGCTQTTSATALDRTKVSCNNNGVFDSMIYAIQNNVAPILSLSYGTCEAGAGYAATVLEPILAQGSSQGQTVVVASGDWGPVACETLTGTRKTIGTVAMDGISVSYPASSPNVTAVGGTMLSSSASTYWLSTNNSYGGSAIGYMPEVAWNDTAQYQALSASGGGASSLFGKPSWQTGSGVPADNARDIPDVSLPASVQTNAYLVCMGDTKTPCTAGNSWSGTGSLVGGTSAAAPNFAAMLALIEQANGVSGLGNINASLYTLAREANASSIFHDITSGNNIVACQGGTPGCSSTEPTVQGTMGSSAGTGYDLVTGLGSLDGAQLAIGLKSNTTASKQTPTVSLSAEDMAPAGGTMDRLTVLVAGNGSVPTGSVTIAIDGSTVSTPTLDDKGSSSYLYTVPACAAVTPCTHAVVATYSGDANYNGSTATVTLNVATSSTPASGSIALAAGQSTLTVTSGNSATNTFTITSAGFAGTVSFAASVNKAIAACYEMPPVDINGDGTTTATFTLKTSSSSCSPTSGSRLSSSVASLHAPSLHDGGFARTGMAVFAAGLVGAFALRRKMRPAALLLLLFSLTTFGLSGCGGSSSSANTGNTGNTGSNGSGNTGTSGSGSTTVTTAAPGTYAITITATGTPSSGAAKISVASGFTLVVQ